MNSDQIQRSLKLANNYHKNRLIDPTRAREYYDAQMELIHNRRAYARNKYRGQHG